MTSHFELLTWEFLYKYFFRVTNSIYYNKISLRVTNSKVILFYFNFRVTNLKLKNKKLRFFASSYWKRARTFHESSARKYISCKIYFSALNAFQQLSKRSKNFKSSSLYIKNNFSSTSLKETWYMIGMFFVIHHTFPLHLISIESDQKHLQLPM